MRISTIRQKPETVREIPPDCNGVHESVLRSWHIVEKVVELLEAGTPAPVVLELIEDMRSGPGGEYP